MGITEVKPVCNVVAGVIKEGEKFFIAQRSRLKDFGLKWEFPGGKVETGETFQDALKRELWEELNLTIHIERKISEVAYRDLKSNILLHYFLCKRIGNIKLLEHEKGIWIPKSDFHRFEFAPGDGQILKLL